MINFFGNRKKAQAQVQATDSENSLRSLEWKVNVLILLVGVLLALELMSFASAIISKSTILIVLVLLGVVGWFLRERILVTLRRTIAERILGEGPAESATSADGHREGSIR